MYQRPDNQDLIDRGIPVTDTFSPVTALDSLNSRYDKMARDELQRIYELEQLRDQQLQQQAQAQAQAQELAQQQQIQQQSQTGGSEDDGYSWWQKGIIGDVLRSGANIYPSLAAPAESLVRNAVGSNPNNLSSTELSNWINNKIPVSQEEIDEQNRLAEIRKREGGRLNFPWIKEYLSYRNLKHAVPEMVGTVGGLALPVALAASLPFDAAVGTGLGSAALSGGVLEGLSGAGQELINKDINRKGIPTWQELGASALNIPATMLSYRLFPGNVFGKSIEGNIGRRAALGGLEEAGQEGFQNVAQEALSESTNDQGQFDFSHYNPSEIVGQGIEGATLGAIAGGAISGFRGGYQNSTSESNPNINKVEPDLNTGEYTNEPTPSPSSPSGSEETLDFGPISDETKQRFNQAGVSDSDLYDITQNMPGSIKADINNLDDDEVREASDWINNGGSSEGYHTNPTMNTIKDHVNAARDNKFDNFINQIKDLEDLHNQYADVYNGNIESTGSVESDVENANKQLDDIQEAINNKVNDIRNQNYDFKNDYDRARFVDHLNNIKKQSIDTIYSKYANPEKNDIDNLVIDTNSKLVDTFNNLINQQVSNVNKFNVPKEQNLLSTIDLGGYPVLNTPINLTLETTLPYRSNQNLKTLYKPRKFKVKRSNNKVEDRILEVPTFQDLDLPKYSQPIELREFQNIQRTIEGIKRNQTRYVNKRARELETNLTDLLLNKDIDINDLPKYSPHKLKNALGPRQYKRASNLIADINTYRKNNHIRLADEFKLNIPKTSRNDLNKYIESHQPSFSEWDRVNNRYEGSIAEPMDDTDADIGNEVRQAYSDVELSKEAHNQIDEYNRLISNSKDDLYVMSQYKHRRDQVYNAMKYGERLPKFNPFIEINNNYRYGALPREARRLVDRFSPDDKGYIYNHLNPMTNKYTDILAKKYGNNIQKASEHANLLHKIINRISHMKEEYSTKPIRGRKANQDEVIARSFEPYAPLNQQLINLNDVTSMRYKALLDRYGLNSNMVWAEVSPKYQPGFIREVSSDSIIDPTNEKYLVLDGRYNNETIESEILAQALMNGDRPLSPEGYREDVSFYNTGLSVEDNFATEGFGDKLSKFLKNIGSNLTSQELKSYMLDRDNSKYTGNITTNSEVVDEVTNAQGNTIDELINHIPNQDMQARFKNYYETLGKNTESFGDNTETSDKDNSGSGPSSNTEYGTGSNTGSNTSTGTKRKNITEDDIDQVKKDYKKTNESNDGDGLVSCIALKDREDNVAGFIRKVKDHSYVVDYRGGRDSFQSLDQAIKYAREKLELSTESIVSTYDDDTHDFIDFNLIKEPTRRKWMKQIKEKFGDNKRAMYWLTALDEFMAARRVHHIDHEEQVRRALRSVGLERLVDESTSVKQAITNEFLSDKFANDVNRGAGRLRLLFNEEYQLRNKYGWTAEDVDAMFLSKLNKEMGRRLLDEANIQYTEDTLNEILDNPETFSKAGQTKKVVTFTGHMAPDGTPDISGRKWRKQFLDTRSKAEQVLANEIVRQYVDFREKLWQFALEKGLITEAKYNARMSDKFWVTTADDVDSTSYQLVPKYGRITRPKNVLKKSITLMVNEVVAAANNQHKWRLIQNLHKVSGTTNVVINPKRVAYTTKANSGDGQNTEIALLDTNKKDGDLYSIKQGDYIYHILVRDKLVKSLFEEDLPKVWDYIGKWQRGRSRLAVFLNPVVYFVRDFSASIINFQAAAGGLLEKTPIATLVGLNTKMMANTASYFESHVHAMFSKDNKNAWQTNMYNRLFVDVNAGVDFSGRFGVIPKTLKQDRISNFLNRNNTTYKLLYNTRRIADMGSNFTDVLEQGFRVGYFRTLLDHLHGKGFKSYEELKSYWNSLDKDTQFKIINGTRRITLDYTKHGDAARLRNFYMFYNTTMQGLDILSDALSTPHGLISIGVMGLIATAYYHDNKDKFEDAKDVTYLKGLPISDDTIVPMNGEHTFIPKIFLYAAMASDGKISHLDAIMNTLEAINQDLSPIRFGQRRIKDSRDIGLNLITATGPLEPFLDAFFNTTAYGDIVPPLVYNPATGKNEKLLNHLMYNKNKVSPTLVGFTNFLYNVLGIDISPNQIDAFDKNTLQQLYKISQNPDQYYSDQINMATMMHRTEMSRLMSEVSDAKNTLDKMTVIINSAKNQGIRIPQELLNGYERGKKIYNHRNYLKSKDTKGAHNYNQLIDLFHDDPKREFSPQAINYIRQYENDLINWNKNEGKKLYEKYKNFLRDNQ